MAQTVEEYVSFLRDKGFKLSEEALGFIAFGKKYTNASDEIVRVAIEATLKQQRHFDGSYFIGVLEQLQREQIKDRKSAQAYVRRLER